MDAPKLYSPLNTMSEQFENIWSGLVSELGIAPPTQARARKHDHDLKMDDPFIDQLEILSWSRDGKKAFITCPFEDQHSMNSGESECCYMPAGTEGYEQGHFKCLHAHCEARADREFQDALGLQLCMFDPLPPLVDESGVALKGLPVWMRSKQGEPLATLDNVVMAVERLDICGFIIAKDTFLEEIMIKPDGNDWRTLEDEDYTLIRHRLEKTYSFKPISPQMIRDCVHLAARNNKFDSAYEYVNGLKWDGVSRVATFYEKYMNVSSSPYAHAVSMYTWTAMAGRALCPGVKADMSPILVGKQGIRKSTGIEAMAPWPELFVDVSLSDNEDDRIRRTKGRLLGELSEMRGLYSAALEAMKAYLVRTHDTWIPKYKEQPVTYPRRIFFIGTSNDMDMFTDSTGNRRWLPMMVNGEVDVEAIKRDCSQLWAEGVALFKQHGVMFQEAERLALHEHEKYEVSTPWEEMIVEWLNAPNMAEGNKPLDKGYVTMNEILQHALGHSKFAAHGGHSKTASAIMRKLGFDKKVERIDGRQRRIWFKQEEMAVTAVTTS